MRKIFSLLMFTILTINLVAQEFEVPKNYVLEQKEDYSKYEVDILKGIDWLTQTPINQQAVKRKEINTFVMEWLTGSPTVNIEIKQEIVSFLGSNPDLVMIFMCGWTKYSLETKDFSNKIKGNQLGVEAVIDFYLKNKENLKKDKNVEKYIKLKEEGKLNDYISKNVE